VLVTAAERAGLDPVAARDVLASGRFADHVRRLEREWSEAGISSVPAVIINEKYLISGGHPADAFERALRTIAAEA
jgi:predicted DsbA family dithiol-disulfide isomerase